MSAAKGKVGRPRQSLSRPATLEAADSPSPEDNAARLAQLAALDDLLAFQTYAKTYNKYEKKRDDRTAEWTTFPRRGVGRDLKADLGSQDLATLPVGRLRTILKDALPRCDAQQQDAAVKLVRIWHGFQQSNLFSLHVQGSTAASTSSSRAITTIKQRRKIPGLDLKSTLNSLILRVGPMETAQELVDAGVPSGILISNENSDDWLLALGPGSHVKRACGACFYVCTQKVPGNHWASISHAVAQEDQATGKDLFFYGGPVYAGRCSNPQHDEFSRTYATTCSDHGSIQSYTWIDPSGRDYQPVKRVNRTVNHASTPPPGTTAYPHTPFNLSLDAQLPLASDHVLVGEDDRRDEGRDRRRGAEGMPESRRRDGRTGNGSTGNSVTNGGKGASSRDGTTPAASVLANGATVRTSSRRVSDAQTPVSTAVGPTDPVQPNAPATGPAKSQSALQAASGSSSNNKGRTTAAPTSHEGNTASPSQPDDIDMQDGGVEHVDGEVYQDEDADDGGAEYETAMSTSGHDQQVRPDGEKGPDSMPLAGDTNRAARTDVTGSISAQAGSGKTGAASMVNGHRTSMTNAQISSPNALKRKREDSGHSTVSDIVLGGTDLVDPSSPATPGHRDEQDVQHLAPSAQSTNLTGRSTKQRAMGRPFPTNPAEIGSRHSETHTQSSLPCLPRPDSPATVAANEKIKQLETMLREVQAQLASKESAEQNSREHVTKQAEEMQQMQAEPKNVEAKWVLDRSQLEAEVRSSKAAAAQAKTDRESELAIIRQDLAKERLALERAERSAAAERERQELAFELDRSEIAAKRHDLSVEHDHLQVERDALHEQQQSAERLLKQREQDIAQEEKKSRTELEGKLEALAARQADLDKRASALEKETKRLTDLQNAEESLRQHVKRKQDLRQTELSRENAALCLRSVKLDAVERQLKTRTEAQEAEQARREEEAARDARDLLTQEDALKARQQKLDDDEARLEKARNDLGDLEAQSKELKGQRSILEAREKDLATQYALLEAAQGRLQEDTTAQERAQKQLDRDRRLLRTERADFARRCKDDRANIELERVNIDKDRTKLDKGWSDLRAQGAQVISVKAAIQALDDEAEPTPNSWSSISKALTEAQKELVNLLKALQSHATDNEPLALQSMLCCGLVAGLHQRLQMRARAQDAHEADLEQAHKADIKALRDEMAEKEKSHEDEVAGLNAKIAEHSLELMAVIASLTPADNTVKGDRDKAVHRMYRYIANAESELLRAIDKVFDAEDLRSWRRGNSAASLQVQERVAERISASLKLLTDRIRETVAMFGAETSGDNQPDPTAGPSTATDNGRSSFASRARTRRT